MTNITTNKNMKISFITDIKDVDKQKLFYVYREGIQHNAQYYKETEEEIQNAHFEYLTDFLSNKNGILAVLQDDEKYYAAIRILPKEENKYYCEAFEVAKDYRGQGLGKKLYKGVIKHIASNHEHFELEAHTWQTNTASIKSHQSVGFKIDKDYVIRKDGSKDDFGVTLIMKK